MLFAKEISRLYKEKTKNSLGRDIRNRFRSNFSKLLSGLTLPYYKFLAYSIYYGATYKWLFFILFTISNDEILKMKNFFESGKYF